jgi:hypothetical protein
MKNYLACPKRKGKPKISVEVCTVSCRKKKKCREFYIFRNPPLIPELAEVVIRGRSF